MKKSYFDGNLLQLSFLSICGVIFTIFSLGIGYPWAVCMVYGWKINHTVIEGRRLRFVGTPMNLIGSWIKYLFLFTITGGIYYFWLRIAIEEWKAKNTYFAN